MGKGTVAQVNNRLRKMGKTERLARGRGYFYFRGGEAMNWNSSSVYTNNPDAFSVDEWLREYENLSKNRI